MWRFAAGYCQMGGWRVTKLKIPNHAYTILSPIPDLNNSCLVLLWFLVRFAVHTDIREDIVMIEIPVWEKYTLTIEEAAAYFRIGENKLRRIIADDPNADFVIWNGSRAQIKRKKFEEFIDKTNAI